MIVYNIIVVKAKRKLWMDLPLVLVIMWAGFIFGASSIPGSDLPSIEVSDKLIHLAVYLVFGFLLMWWRGAKGERHMGPSMFQAVMIGSIYGITDELHQGLVSGRTPDPADWVADTFGVFLGALFFLAVAFIFVKRQKAQ